MSAVETLPTGLRFVGIAASSIQAPGAKGTDHRLHLAMDLRTLPLVEVLVSAVHTGETLTPFTLEAGDVAMADRGSAHAQGMREAVKQGAELLVRLNPFRVVLYDPTGQSLSWCGALKRPHMATIRTLAVVMQSACGQHEVRGWVHASRVSAEHAVVPGKNAASAIKAALPKRRAAFWQAGYWSLPPGRLRCSRPRRS